MKNKAKLLSILIPVFNTERYLETCFESILKSAADHIEDIEIIVVDDGSIDKSGEICDTYSARYPATFKVTHKNNEGTGATRNLLLSLADTEYFWFVDSDDTITEDAISKIVKELSSPQQCEILSFCLQRYYKNDEFLPAEGIPSKKGVMTGEEYLLSNQFNGFMCNKVYRTNFIRQHNISFNSNLISQEDTLFHFEALVHCKYINITDHVLYNYFQGNPNSTLTNKSRNFSERKIRDSIIAEKEMSRIIKETEEIQVTQSLQKILNYHISGFLYALMITDTSPSKVREVIEELRDYSLYPVGNCIGIKANIFLKLVNYQTLFILICRFYKFFHRYLKSLSS